MLYEKKTILEPSVDKPDDLHNTLIDWYALPGDKFEVPLDSYIIDIVRGDMLIEIQTKNFSALKVKLNHLIKNHNIRLVYPISCEKQIIRMAADGVAQLSRRKSPKCGAFEQVFDELVSFPDLFLNSRFSLELIMVQGEEFRHLESQGCWRRHGWTIDKRRLADVIDRRLFQTPQDLKSFIPDSLKDEFTTIELAVATHQNRRLAQKMAYCLKRAGCLKMVGKRGNAILYSRAEI